MMFFEVSIIKKKKKKKIFTCVLRPPPPSEWLSSGVISGQPLALSLGVAWGINEVVAHRSICYALLMKYKDMVLLTRAPTHSSSSWHAEEVGLLLVSRCLVFNGDKVNFSICQSALQPISCALRNTIVSLSKAIHLNFFDAAWRHHGEWKDVMPPSKYQARLEINLF